MLELAVQHVTPAMAGRSYPRIWDAGCATGQEPYSLSILMAETMGHFAFSNLRIFATDLDSHDQFGSLIAAGVYAKAEVERIPRELLDKYFEPAEPPGYFRVAANIRERIVFQKHDLTSLREIGHNFSLIVCKNVLLHLQPAERAQVIGMFHRALGAGGYLATEQTQKLPADCGPLFERVVSDGQLFRKVELKRNDFEPYAEKQAVMVHRLPGDC